MIKVHKVTKIFPPRLKAINDLSFDIPDGEVVGFVGPNGSGKTTMLRMLTGVYQPNKGEIWLDDMDMSICGQEIKKKIGFVSDSPDMFLRLTGLEYLNFIADIYEVSMKKRKKNILQLSEEFDLKRILEDQIISYSHGMRQKIMVAGALIHDPEYWILDEPMVGLDPKSSFMMKQKMRDHARQGKTVFFSTHVLEVAERVCDQIIVINEGRLVYQGTLASLKRRYAGRAFSLEKIYLDLIEKDLKKHD